MRIPLVLLVLPALASCAASVDPGPLAGADPAAATVRAQERQRAATLYRDGLRLARGDGVAADPERGGDMIRRAAELGHAEAQAFVGTSHLVGTVDASRAEAAAYWLERAALQGHAGAARRLGRLHADGEGVPRDRAWSVVWLARAAERGDGEAQFELAMLLIAGENTRHDMAEATAWLTRVAAAGHPDAARYRDAAASKLSDGERADLARHLERPLRRGAVANPDPPLLRFVQQALTSLGRDPGTVDGIDGPATRRALAAFARDEKLPRAEGYVPAVLDRLRVRRRELAGG
ncbi:MAG: SEL1-like repeat protein [Alphaproteobacteria bacterium]|nr:SEL1-like repeat protein [Alphaproteobacteria bacterium]